MCGIVGVVSGAPVNQLIYDALLLLQHRGQDAAGIVTQQARKFFMHKAKGMVRDVFRTRNMRALPRQRRPGPGALPDRGQRLQRGRGAAVLRQRAVRHRAGAQRQPDQRAGAEAPSCSPPTTATSTPRATPRCCSTCCAHELEKATRGLPLKPEAVFEAVRNVHRRVRGSYAVIALIAGHGVLAFRDPFGIRPLSLGRGKDGSGDGGQRVGGAGRHRPSRSSGTWRRARRSSSTWRARCTRSSAPTRPSLLSLHLRVRLPGAARLGAGRHLGLPGAPEPGRDAGQARDLHRAAERDRRRDPDPRIEPAQRHAARAADRHCPTAKASSRTATSAAPSSCRGRACARRSVRQKLNAIVSEFKGRNVLLVDDSIVRGTTSQEIVQMARDAGARKVYLASAAPPVRYPNVYGIDMPTAASWWRTAARIEEVRAIIGCDALIYQDVDGMKTRGLGALNPDARLTASTPPASTASTSPATSIADDIARINAGAGRPGRSAARKTPRAWRCPTRRTPEPADTMTERKLPPGLHRETLAVRAGVDTSQYGENSEALYLSSSFVQPDAETAARRFAGDGGGLHLLAHSQSHGGQLSSSGWPRSKAPKRRSARPAA